MSPAAGEPDARDARVDELLANARRINRWVVIAAFAAYGLAWYAWTESQTLGAVVIATLGYLLFRSMRRISFNLTWQSYAARPEYAPILRCLDDHWLSRPPEQVRAHVKQAIEEQDSD